MMIGDHHRDVRTTLTLDPDVAATLKAAMRRSGKSFRETSTTSLRLGLNSRESARSPGPFVVRPRPLGRRTGVSYDNVWELVAELEEAERS
jgi:hypothetical protein